MNNKLNMSQQYTLAGREAKHILVCIRKTITSKSRYVMFALSSALVILHSESYVQFWASQYKRDFANLDQIHQAEGQQARGLEHFSSEERPGELLQGMLLNTCISSYFKTNEMVAVFILLLLLSDKFAFRFTSLKSDNSHISSKTVQVQRTLHAHNCKEHQSSQILDCFIPEFV